MGKENGTKSKRDNDKGGTSVESKNSMEVEEVIEVGASKPQIKSAPVNLSEEKIPLTHNRVKEILEKMAESATNASKKSISFVKVILGYISEPGKWLLNYILDS